MPSGNLREVKALYYSYEIPVFGVSSFSGSMSELHSISFISVHYNIVICYYNIIRILTGLFSGPVRSCFSTGPHFLVFKSLSFSVCLIFLISFFRDFGVR